MTAKNTQVKYVGPYQEVEVDVTNENEWMTVKHGETVDVTAPVGKGLLEQPDNWVEPGETRRRTSKPKVDKGTKPSAKSPATADETPSEPVVGNQED